MMIVTVSQAAVMNSFDQRTAVEVVYVTLSLFTAYRNLLEELGEAVPILVIKRQILTQTISSSTPFKAQF